MWYIVSSWGWYPGKRVQVPPGPQRSSHCQAVFVLLICKHMQKIKITVLPRSSRNEIIGKMSDGSLKIKLTAPPVGGEANKKLVEILSKEFGVAKSKISIVKGKSSKRKVVCFEE